MDAALAQALKELAYKLIALASGETAPSPTDRPGMVAVRPTGALGGGVVHWWPATEEVQGENAWGYMSRMSRTKNRRRLGCTTSRRNCSAVTDSCSPPCRKVAPGRNRPTGSPTATCGSTRRR